MRFNALITCLLAPMVFTNGDNGRFYNTRIIDNRAGRHDVTTGKLFYSRGECLGLYRCILIIFKRK